MKKMYAFAIGIVWTLLVFTSCTENTISSDDETILETQAIDKDDSTNPNNNGGSTVDPDED